jgi:hypothetical protein
MHFRSKAVSFFTTHVDPVVKFCIESADWRTRAPEDAMRISTTWVDPVVENDTAKHVVVNYLMYNVYVLICG